MIPRNSDALSSYRYKRPVTLDEQEAMISRIEKRIRHWEA